MAKERYQYDEELMHLLAMAEGLGFSTEWVDRRMARATNEATKDNEDQKARYFENILRGFVSAKKSRSRKKILKRLHRLGYTITYDRKTFWDRLTRSKKNPRIKKVLDKDPQYNDQALGNFYKKFFYQDVAKREHDMSQSCIERLKKRLDAICGNDAEIRKLDQARLAQNCCTEDGVLNPERQGLVHATYYLGDKDKEGRYNLESLSTSSGLIDARNTLHFAVGDHVASHMEGGWNEAPFVFITSLQDLMREHGKPLGMSLVDTFFDVGLNENLRLPKDTHLIKPAPGKLPDGVDFVTHGNLTLFRTSGFSEQSKERLKTPYERENGKDISDIEMAIRTKFRVVGNVLDHKGFMVFHCMCDTAQAEQVKRLADKLNVFGIAGATLHADWSLFGGNNWYGQRMTSLNSILRELEWNTENKYGIKVSEMLPSVPHRVGSSKYESLDKKTSLMEQIKKGTNLSDDIEALRWEQISEMSTPSVRDYIEWRSQKDKEWIDADPERRKWEEEWHKPRLRALMERATQKEKEVYEAWVKRTQQRVDVLKEVKKRIDSPSKKRKMSVPTR